MKDFLPYSSGYAILEAVENTMFRTVYEGVRKIDGQPAAVIFLKAGNPSRFQAARFKSELDLISRINHPRIVRVIDVLPVKRGFAIVQEPFSGVSLHRIMAAGPPGVHLFLEIAAGVVEGLDVLHKNGLIHGNINPQSVMVDMENRSVKLHNFGSMFLITREDKIVREGNRHSAGLAYVSPEQTGRLNRAVDHRSDLYSAGVLFYEMLTGKVPFFTTDPMAVVHAHLASTPRVPSEINPKIPEILSQIVMKLLAKAPEERYQNSFGVEADLRECLLRVTPSGRIPPFQPGLKDVSLNLGSPGKLFGRERETAVLMSAYEAAIQKKRAAVFVSGAPGIGKTALVESFRKSPVGSRGWFLSGKYDEFNLNLPYQGIITALNGLKEQLLAENDAYIKEVSLRARERIGSNAGVLIDLSPEFEFILGERGAPVKSGPEEAENRFFMAVKNFISVFCSTENPLVLFLDDLQWSDESSLRLIRDMVQDQDMEGFLFIGAFRDHIMDSDHLLNGVIDELEQSPGIRFHRVTPGPMQRVEIRDLLSYLLKCSKGEAEALGRQVHRKTGGNPFFVYQFLRALIDRRLLEYDPGAGWRRLSGKIEAMQVTDNVLSLMAGTMAKLSPRSWESLKIYACAGSSLNVETQAEVQGISMEAAFAAIAEAVDKGLLSLHDDTCRFCHDRIREAAYSLIPDSEKARIHYRIGTVMSHQGGTEESDTKLFRTADQLNMGQSEISSDEERDRLIDLNLQASRKAGKSAAFSAADGYISAALALSPENSWTDQYEFMLKIYAEAVENAFLNGNYRTMEKRMNTALKHARSTLDRVPLLEVKIQSLISRRRLAEAIGTALETASALGVYVPEHPGKLRLLGLLTRVRMILYGKRKEYLLNLPDITDPKIRAAVKILSRITAASNSYDPNLFVYLNLKRLLLNLRYGNTDMSPSVFGTYGIILISVLNDIDNGFKFGELMIDLLDRYSCGMMLTRSYIGKYIFIHHWKRHLGETVDPLWKGYRTGLETGNLEFGSYCLVFHDIHKLLTGRPMSDLLDEMERHYAAIVRMNQKQSYHVLRIFLQLVVNMTEPSSAPSVLSGRICDSRELAEAFKEGEDLRAEAMLYWAELYLAYHFASFERACEIARKTRGLLNSIRGFIFYPLFFVYDSLAAIALCRESGGIPNRKIIQKVKKNQKRIRKWAESSPMNLLQKYTLVEAELHGLLGDRIEAGDAYDRAAGLSRSHGYINDEALCNELAAEHYLKLNKERIAGAYLTEAAECYALMGASGKQAYLKRRFPQIVFSTDRALQNGTAASVITPGHESLDLNTVIKANQTLSEEIEPDRLMVKLMRLVLENAGAQRGIMILDEDEGLVAAAEGWMDREGVWEPRLERIPLADHDEIALSIVNYSIRKKESVILEDASEKGNFRDDPYVARRKPRSILCKPVFHQGRCVTVFYLENNLGPGVFTRERRRILDIIAGQAAISLVNASLYDNLTREIKIRRETEKALVESEEKYRKVVEHAGEGICIVQDEIIRFSNPKLSEMAGTAPGELNGKPMKDFVYPKDRDKVLSRYRTRIDGDPVPSVYSFRGISRTGKILWIEVNAVRIPWDGKPGTLYFMRDITQQKQLESDLIQAHKMESVGTLAGGIAHDFNNMLQAISGYAQMLSIGKTDTDPDMLKLGKIEDLVDRASDLTRRLLIFSRKVESELKPTDLNAEVNQVVKILERTIMKMIRIETRPAPDLKMINADPLQLEQIMMNLGVNARDAMPDGGKLIFATRNVALSPEFCMSHLDLEPGEYVLLTVTDTGYGMTADTISRIFEPFFTTKDSGKGTGLGLAMVYGIVNNHKAKIICESAPGKGTRFEIYFPAIRDGKQVKKKAQPKSDERPEGYETILLVDDEPDVLDIGKEILAKFGYSVLTAASGEEAVSLYEEMGEGLSLVILDMNMPGMGGDACAAALKKIRPEVKILIATGYVESEQVSRELHVSGIISKPFRMSEILEKVRAILDDEELEVSFENQSGVS